MKFHIFEVMSKSEAEDYLNNFLIFGKERGMKLLNEKVHFSRALDFTVDSLPVVFKALVPILRAVAREEDPNVPEFIRKTEDYKKGLFDFDASSNTIILAVAYYLGETFVRRFPKLKWSTGNTDFRESNMPVVTGFNFKIELAPILISENIFRGAVSGRSEESSIDIAIEMWSTKFF